MKRTEGKIKIGVLGAGRVSRDMHLPVLANIPEAGLTWLCDKNEQRARKLAKLYSIPAVYTRLEECSEVDIVLVAIPVGYRPALMDYIFRRGWHVFCEKPFAVSLSEHDRYLTAAVANNVQVAVGLVRRYGSATLMAKKIVRGGYFGPVIQVWANEGTRTKRTGQGSDWYLTDPKVAGGGVLMETGSHLVDQICTILDINDYKLHKCTQRKFKDLEYETIFIGTISNDNQQDIRCTFEVSRLEDLCNGIFIQFPNFLLKCGLFFEEPLELLRLNGNFIANFDLDKGANTISQALYLEWQDFLTQCTTGNSHFVRADTARHSTAIIEHCYKNADIIDISTAMER
jgi:predicted dehydrogenase